MAFAPVAGGEGKFAGEVEVDGVDGALGVGERIEPGVERALGVGAELERDGGGRVEFGGLAVRGRRTGAGEGQNHFALGAVEAPFFQVGIGGRVTHETPGIFGGEEAELFEQALDDGAIGRERLGSGCRGTPADDLPGGVGGGGAGVNTLQGERRLVGGGEGNGGDAREFEFEETFFAEADLGVAQGFDEGRRHGDREEGRAALELGVVFDGRGQVWRKLSVEG